MLQLLSVVSLADDDALLSKSYVHQSSQPTGDMDK